MIVVIDNFLKDENLIRSIKEDKKFFADPGVYYWWDGWWNSPADTTKKVLIEQMWRYNSPLYHGYKISGVEYWTGIQTAMVESGHKNHLVRHFDKDEAWFDKTGEIVSPVIGTVYYPIVDETFEGGELLIYTEGADKAPEVIKALPNRMIIFDAGTVVHEVAPVTSGTRKAIAVNLWTNIPYAQTVGSFSIE
jgi:hypothetical protein